MDAELKRRLVGATVLIVAALIVVPMLFDDEPKLSTDSLPVDIPKAPERDFESQILPLDDTDTAPSSVSEAMGIDPANQPIADGNAVTNAAPVQSDDSIATVDTQVPERVDAITGENVNAVAPSDSVVDSVPAPKPDSSATPSSSKPTASEPSKPMPASVLAKPVLAKPVPVETTPASAPTVPAVAAAGRYLVNFGSFSKRENADAVMASLKAKGVRAFIETISVNGQSALRLRAGPFRERAEAERVRLIASSARSDIQPSVVERDDTAAAVASLAKPTAGASAPGAFAVQVGAFSAQADANALVTRLKAANLPAYLEKISAEAGTLWRVRVGPAPTRERAELLANAIKQKAGLDARVVPHP